MTGFQLLLSESIFTIFWLKFHLPELYLLEERHFAIFRRSTSIDDKETLRVDFHIHTTYSDGLYSPQETLEKISAAGIEFASFADHESVDAYLAVANSIPSGLHFYPAAEFSTYYKKNEIHFLTYFTEGISEKTRQFLAELQAERMTRAKIAVVNLKKAGVKISYDDVKRFATGENISRAHIARALVACGAVETIHEAFSLYLDFGKEIVPPPFLTPERLFRFASENNALVIWAHPEVELFDVHFKEFVDCGLSGVEVCSKKRQEIFTFYIERTALSLGLILTYGSDWHGFLSEQMQPIYAPKAHIEKFLSFFVKE